MTSIGDQLREQTVDTALGRIRLQIAGSGSPIIFWPSLLMTGEMWHGVADDLIALQQVVLVDPPGQGGSQALTSLFSFDDCARCVVTTFRQRPDVVEHVRTAVKAIDVASVSWAVKTVVPRRPDQRTLLGTIKTPVLVVGGAEDATFPPREAIAMADAIPNSSVRVLDGVAHLAGLENPPLVSALLEQFLFGGSERKSGAT